ncbi:MAG: ribosomal protein S18-alanine N-acetyltransferase [Acholeplasmataceae bacterium]|jgi:ribosomal-protein-alanine N-acetyltransferase|nr:ribosomal protein S18-alanine N-acetyltransferase [Acholeplasmataceae bacterium]
MKYQIRPLEEKDIPAIIDGEKEVFGDSLGFDLIYSDIKLNPYAHYLVLDIDDEVGGYIGLWITEENAEVINFYIAKRYQCMGFGTILLNFAIDLCQRCNVDSLSLEVRENNHVARHLYEKHGFIFSHRRERYYRDGSDALLLIKKFEVKK